MDPFNGQIAIENKLLTAVGNAKDRLSEDRLRAFRALRFAVTKSFIIDWQLQKAITEIQPGEYDSVSTERIREEIHKAFKANTSFAFHLLNNVYPWLWQVIIRRGIWFKPTTEE